MTGRAVFCGLGIGGAGTSTRYNELMRLLKRDQIRHEITEKDGCLIVTYSGTVPKRRRTRAHNEVTILPAILDSETIRKRLAKLVGAGLPPGVRRSRADKWAWVDYHDGRRNAEDKAFGRAVGRLISIHGKNKKLNETELEAVDGCWASTGRTLRVTANSLIEGRRKWARGQHSPVEWKPIKKRYTVEQVSDIAYHVELLRLAIEREEKRKPCQTSELNTTAA